MGNEVACPPAIQPARHTSYRLSASGDQTKEESMKLLITTVLIALINVSTYPAVAGHVTGIELLAYCESNKLAEWGFCSGFIWGAADSHELIGEEVAPFCVPEDAASEQMGLIVVKFLREHPEKHDEFAVLLVALALEEAWPCGT